MLIHGFTQTGASWDPVLPHLVGSGVVAHAPDLPDSPDLWMAAAELSAWIVAHVGPDPVAIVGYSMGGRIALHLALAHPERVDRLILIGATGGLDTGDERDRRRSADAALADTIEAGGSGGIDGFLDRWVAQPLFAGLPKTAADRAARSRDPALLAGWLRHLGTGTQEPLWDRLHTISVPVLCVAGAEDAKFVALARRLNQAIGPQAGVSLVADAGHACHLEQPGAFAALLRNFLQGDPSG